MFLEFSVNLLPVRLNYQRIILFTMTVRHRVTHNGGRLMPDGIAHLDTTRKASGSGYRYPIDITHQLASLPQDNRHASKYHFPLH